MCLVSAAMLAPAAMSAAQATATFGTMATLINISMAASAIGMGMQAYGTYQQQKSTNAQMEYKAKLDERNAQVAQMEADYAREAAANKEAQHRKQVRQFVGKQRAAQSSSGSVVDEGSFLDVNLDAVESGELDAMAILHEGEVKAWGAEINAGNYRSQSVLHRSSTASPFMAAAPGVFKGVSNLGKDYVDFKKM